MLLRSREGAAKYLSERTGLRFTADNLAARASTGTGPKYATVAGRAAYADQWLDEWLEAQLRTVSPSAKGRRRAGRAT